MDFIVALQQFINMKAVVVAVALTQAIKYLLPSPTPDRTTEIVPGHVFTRLMPFVPVLIACLFTFYIERDSKYTLDDAIRGGLSGVFAAYLNRMTKVSIFGE